MAGRHGEYGRGSSVPDGRSPVRALYALLADVSALYVRIGGSQFAAAMSYRALFSLVPLATFGATILAQVLSSGRADQDKLVAAIADRLELSAQGEAKLDVVITAVPSPWSLTGLVTLTLALWGATGVMTSMQKALAVIFDDGISRSLFRGRIVSALLVLGALGLLLAAVLVSMLESIVRTVSETVGEALGWQPPGLGLLFGVVAPTALTVGVLLMLYRYLPRHRPGWRPALLGAAIAAVGLQVVQASLSWYLSGPADFTKLYGSAGAVFAFLFSVYLAASVFVGGGILTAAIDDPRRREVVR